MDPRTTERVERWDSRPFADGYDGLSDLADREFSGAVTAAGTWLFMLNGRVVGIVDGTIEDFDGATGTTYEAPDPALPLLCSMEETGGETRAKYYTNETPLEEVDGTLSSGSFTGYVELSEGVLSGDYYAVYYGGRRMAAAYIGNAQRLLTGEEAFERAADEVGIYEVVDVDVDVTDVPGSEESTPGETGSDSGATPTSSAAGSSPSVSVPDTDSDAETDSPAEAAGADNDATADSERTVESESSSASTSAATDDEAADPRSGIDLESQSESEPELDPDPVSNPDSTLEDAPSGITTADGESAESTTPGITDELSSPIVDEATDTSTTETEVSESEPNVPSDDEGATAPARSADEDVDSTTVDEAETDRSRSSSPNPDDLEAAAEELSESGVPWSSSSSVDSNSDANSNSSASSDANSETPTVEGIDITVDEPADADESTAELEERFKQEEQWRETRSIPSIDPDNTAESAAPPSNRRGTKKRTRKQTQNQNQKRSRGHSSAGASQSHDRDSGRTGSQSGSESESESGSGSRPGAGSETGSPTNTNVNTERTDRAARPQSSGGRPDTGQQSRPDDATQQSSRGRAGGARSPEDADALESDMLEREDKIDRLTQQLDDLEQRRDELETKAADLEHERDRLESENQELTETVERLESRIEELETELERVRSADATGAVAEATDARGTELSPQQALAGTNLFVRYGSKSQPTLEAAHDGDVDAASVNSNLLLEHHTQFDETDVSVDGVPYEEFLASTMEYQFVDWLTGTLLYEIRDTGHATSLGDLYDVIPRIDRAELHASISLEDDNTDEVPDQVSFDVVAFDKRGTPLVAANLNDSRDPATREMLIDLEETASAVNANFPDLGAAIVVTSSYFDPGALEIAEQATSGGFLSRGSKLSYVNLSRKQGYHMCLVESRSGGFHMNVPEL